MLLNHFKLTKYLFVLFACFFVTAMYAQDGKTLFVSKCQTCHSVSRNLTGPALKDLEERHTWKDHKVLLKWINNPAAYMKNDDYTQALHKQYKIEMTAFPDLTLEDVNAIVDYINQTAKEETAVSINADEPKKNNSSVYIIFGSVALVLTFVALLLMKSNGKMRRMIAERDGTSYIAEVPFYLHKKFLAISSVILFFLGGYLIVTGAIGLGREKKYMPKQPIFFSHKVHAGINQINCLYCHSDAMESKQASIPSVNICMNCHKDIQAYVKGPQLYDASGNKIDGTEEIKKLFSYANFDINNPIAWDASQAKPIPWIRIHNLPDFVFFNHAEHVNAGQVQCQTCHGEVTAMDEMYQFSELSMGWCINCHRTTKVNFNTDSTGNKFYDLYEAYHEAIKAGRMDSVTVKDIGGLDCQKCHY